MVNHLPLIHSVNSDKSKPLLERKHSAIGTKSFEGRLRVPHSVYTPATKTKLSRPGKNRTHPT